MAFINVPEITIKNMKERVKEYLKDSILYTKKGKKLKEIAERKLAMIIWSIPGIGKSAIIHQAAEEVSEELDVPIEVREYRLGQITIFDLQGPMGVNNLENKAVYYAPPFYDEADQEDAFILYFFDEMDKASGEIRGASLQIVLDHKFLSFPLPEKSIVIGAGNPDMLDDKACSIFEDELNNRFRHYRVRPDFDAWKEWAVGNGINEHVIRFLSAQRQYIHCLGKEGEKTAAFPTPRTWEGLSDYLNNKDPDHLDFDRMFPDICSFIGIQAAGAFVASCRLDCELPDVGDIVYGFKVVVPKKLDAKNTVIDGLFAYIREKQIHLKNEHWENICRYINRFPNDFAAMFYKSILEDESVNAFPLIRCHIFQAWRTKHGNLIDKAF